jgi:hypothetical protein
MKGAFLCWCYKPPQQKPDGTLRMVHYKDAGRENCNCTWSVHYRKNASDRQFHITSITKEHTGHQPLSPSLAPGHGESPNQRRHLRAREDVSEEMVDKMRELVAWSQPSRAYAQLHLSGLFGVTFDDQMFRHIYRTLSAK